MDENQLINLLKQMTLHEKVGQMTQIPAVFFQNLTEEEIKIQPLYSKDVLRGDNLHLVGSVLGVTSAKEINRIQKQYLESSRLKIPLLFMHDAIHGYKTIYPIPLGLACTWDASLLENIAANTATELRAAGIHVNFSPMVDLVRDPRWGRVMETFGEDHLLSSKLGANMVRGYQKTTETGIGKTGVAATLKHFGACGASVAGKEYNTVDMSWREFFDYYGKPYEAVIKERPRFVMSSFNAFNGQPVTGNEEMMNDVLREKYGFEDLTISDWGSVIELTNHRIVATEKEAAMLALESGTDIEMSSATYLENCEEIIKSHPDIIHYIDEVVLKILSLKQEMGLFDNPFANEKEEPYVLMQEKFLQLSLEAAIKSCVLLKNEQDALPIKEKYKHILVVGPFAKSKELLGAWFCEGKFEDVTSIEEGMRDIFQNTQIHVYDSLETCPRDVLLLTDYVVVTIGEYWDLTGEGRSSVNLGLEKSQKQLIRDVKKLHKPYACVALSGRPLALEDIIDDIPALLWAWYPGTVGGLAIAKLLAGITSPSGKLTMSFPRHSAQVPIYYNEYSSGRPTNASSYSNRYQDCEPGPLFSFGHGLTYGEIAYENYALSRHNITAQTPITITFDLVNNTPYHTQETSILYIKDMVSRGIRPTREMKKWQVTKLAPYERKRVEMTLELNDLTYLDMRLKQVVEPGEFKIYINDLKNSKFLITY